MVCISFVYRLVGSQGFISCFSFLALYAWPNVRSQSILVWILPIYDFSLTLLGNSYRFILLKDHYSNSTWPLSLWLWFLNARLLCCYLVRAGVTQVESKENILGSLSLLTSQRLESENLLWLGQMEITLQIEWRSRWIWPGKNVAIYLSFH